MVMPYLNWRLTSDAIGADLQVLPFMDLAITTETQTPESPAFDIDDNGNFALLEVPVEASSLSVVVDVSDGMAEDALNGLGLEIYATVDGDFMLADSIYSGTIASVPETHEFSIAELADYISDSGKIYIKVNINR